MVKYGETRVRGRTPTEDGNATMHVIAQESLATLFTEARTHKVWEPREVSDELLAQVFDLAKWGPTSLNCAPARFVFVKSKKAKAKLTPALLGSNVAQVESAPVTVIVAHDEKFHEHLPTLFPAFDARPMFVSNPALSHETALRNGSLQGAYLIIAARALGLDAGPMSGFDNSMVDMTFLAGTSWKSNFLCNIGYGVADKLFPRGPRLTFEQTCKID